MVRFGFFALCQPRGTNVTALEFTRAASIHSGRGSPPQPGVAKSECALRRGAEAGIVGDLIVAAREITPMLDGERREGQAEVADIRL
jgi:hypothetical protein